MNPLDELCAKLGDRVVTSRDTLSSYSREAPARAGLTHVVTELVGSAFHDSNQALL
jgi:hypothetical protein